MMRKIYLLLILVPAVLSATGQPLSDSALSAMKFAEFAKQGGAQLLDVRTVREYQAGHLPDAMQANWSDPPEFKNRTAHLEKTRAVLVYCQVGARSADAARYLRSQGFKVMELKGGMNEWRKIQGPVITEGTVTQITLEQYLQKIEGDQTVLVNFGGSWCPPCRAMKPILDNLLADSSLHFKSINIDPGEQPGLSANLKIEVLPTYLIYKNGKLSWRGEGVINRDILHKQLK